MTTNILKTVQDELKRIIKEKTSYEDLTKQERSEFLLLEKDISNAFLELFYVDISRADALKYLDTLFDTFESAIEEFYDEGVKPKI